MTQIEQYTGCLLGLAIGDALGAPAAGLTHEEAAKLDCCDQFLPSTAATSFLLPLADMGDAQAGETLEAGQWTEDTQLAMALGNCLIAEGGHFIPESWAHALVRWLNGEPRAPGVSSLQTALQLRTGAVMWDEAADPEGAGSGAAARTAPVALLYPRNTVLRRDAAVAQALVTHGHPDAQAAAVAVAEVISGALAGSGHGGVLLAGALTALQSGPATWDSFRRCLELADSLLEDGIEPAAAVRVLGTSGWCRESVPCALYCAAVPGHTFEEALCLAVSSGGAADAIGAITGAVFGARVGVRAIPEKWQYRVEAADSLTSMARALYRLSERV